MTRRHFVAFATEIKDAVRFGQMTVAEARKAATMVINVARATGANINPERFLRACGLTD